MSYGADLSFLFLRAVWRPLEQSSECSSRNVPQQLGRPDMDRHGPIEEAFLPIFVSDVSKLKIECPDD